MELPAWPRWLFRHLGGAAARRRTPGSGTRPQDAPSNKEGVLFSVNWQPCCAHLLPVTAQWARDSSPGCNFLAQSTRRLVRHVQARGCKTLVRSAGLALPHCPRSKQTQGFQSHNRSAMRHGPKAFT